MTRQAFTVFSLAFLVLAGCLSDAPRHTPTATEALEPEPTRSDAILLSLPDGLVASYSFGPDYPTIRRTNFTITAHVAGEGLTFIHRYDALDDCGNCDSSIEYRLAKDGSWAHAEYPCLPPVPDSRSKGCIEVWGGYGNRDGTRGAFFGTSLLSGLSISADGAVSRSFQFGTTSVTGHFTVKDLGEGRIEVSAADEATRALPFSGFDLEPFDCNVFNGRLTFDIRLGLPVECMIDEDNDDGSVDSFGWALTWTNLKAKVPFVAQGLPGPPVLHPDGVRFPPRDGDDQLPFGLYEAIDYAAGQDGRVRDFVARDGAYLQDSTLHPTSASWTGDCETLCLRMDTWLWEILVQDGTDRIGFNVTKTITTPGDLATLALAEVFDEVPGVVHEAFPAKPIRPLAWYWQNGTEATGHPTQSIYYKASARGEPTNLEPFVYVGFAAAESGWAPHIWYDSTGQIIVSKAKGAVDPL